MKQRVHPVVAVVAIAVVLAAISMIYSRRLQQPPQLLMTPQVMGMRLPEGAASTARLLGGEVSRSASPRGLSVVSLGEQQGPPPLSLMGVRIHDVIVSCNGDTLRLEDSVPRAVMALQSKGTPVILVVSRAGKKITLTADKKLPGVPSGDPAPAVAATPEAPKKQ